jgi:rubredoxin
MAERVCPVCGTKMEYIVEDSTPGVADIPDDYYWKCPNCGHRENPY